MKASSLLPLLAVGIIFAAAAPSPNTAASHLPEFDVTAAPTLSKGYEKYSFDLYINEYCNIDVKFVPFKPELHVYAEFYHNDHEYGWEFARNSTESFRLDDADDAISITHHYDTSETSFVHEDCEWKDGETVDKNCGWCDQGVPWEGPEGANQIDCSEHQELYRHRTITCHFWRKAKPGVPPISQLPPGEDWKDVAAATAEDTTVTTSSNTSIKARTITADGGVPENLYRFGVTHSEWCEDGALKARGWMNGRELNFYKDVTQKIPINLHPGRDLLFGPYSYDQHAFAIEYDGCVWTSEGGWPCGWCEMHPWTLGPLNCQTLQPGYQRTSYRTCYFVDNHMGGKALTGSTAETINQDATAKPFNALMKREELYSDPSLPLANNTLDVPNGAPIAGKARDGSQYYWFRFSLSEHCHNGKLRSRGWWYDGNNEYEVNTYYGATLHLHARTPFDAGVLYVSQYSIDTHSLSFEHKNCKFKSTGGVKGSCGLCHPRPWTMGPLNCDTGAPGPQRDTYIICAFENKDSSQIAGREMQPTPTPSTLPDNTTFEPLAPTITSLPKLIDITPKSGLTDSPHAPTAVVDTLASTLILMPAIIETTLPSPPNTPQSPPQTGVILPIHLQIWEYCFNGARYASGVYTNGNMKQSLDFKPGNVNTVKHRVPGYADLDVGPFDYAGSRLRFFYRGKNGEGASRGSDDDGKSAQEGDAKDGAGGCEWFDNETWKSCGECRAGL